MERGSARARGSPGPGSSALRPCGELQSQGRCPGCGLWPGAVWESGVWLRSRGRLCPAASSLQPGVHTELCWHLREGRPRIRTRGPGCSRAARIPASGLRLLGTSLLSCITFRFGLAPLTPCPTLRGSGALWTSSLSLGACGCEPGKRWARWKGREAAMGPGGVGGAVQPGRRAEGPPSAQDLLPARPAGAASAALTG